MNRVFQKTSKRVYRGVPGQRVCALLFASVLFAPCLSADRILIIGDSWGFRRTTSFQTVIISEHGHSDVEVTAPQRVITSYELSSPSGLARLSGYLNTYPDTTVVHLTIGANDLNIVPETAGTEHAAQVLSEIMENVETVVNHLLSVKPDLNIYWSSYDYFRPRPHIGTPAEMNDIYLTLNEACASLADSIGPPLTYGDIYGTLQLAFGFDGIKHTPYDPSYAIPPNDPSLPDPQWPSPDAAFLRNDAEHLNQEGWLALAEAQYASYYGPLLDDAGFEINAGLNDAWYDPDTNGQGFLITVFPEVGQVFLAWFTYDTKRPPDDVDAILGDPGHRWLTAQGPYEGNTAELTLFVSRGGVFDASDPAPETDASGDGTLTIEFSDCSQGWVRYHISSLDISGEIPIQRIAPDGIPLCETLMTQ